MNIRKIHSRLPVGNHSHQGGTVRVWTENDNQFNQGKPKLIKFFEHVVDGKLVGSGVLSKMGNRRRNK